MRAHRFRPCVDFRPSLDLLMPRTLLSDITTILLSNPDPVPDDPGTPETPATPPPATPTAPVPPPVQTPAVGC